MKEHRIAYVRNEEDWFWMSFMYKNKYYIFVHVNDKNSVFRREYLVVKDDRDKIL